MGRDALIGAAMRHIRRQHDAATRVANREGWEFSSESADSNTVPLAVYWRHLEAFTVVFFDYQEVAGQAWIKYAFRPKDGPEWEYLDQAPHDWAQYPWIKNPLLAFSHDLVANEQTAQVLEQKAYLVLFQHMSVVGYFERFKMLYHLGAVSAHIAENGPLVGDKYVDAKTYHQLCNVMLIAAVEALLHDVFFASWPLWFCHLPERDRDREASKFAAAIGLGEQRTLWWRRPSWSADRVRGQWQTIRDQRRISFQDLRGRRRGAKWAYKQALGIRLSGVTEGVATGAWRHLLDAADGRHSVIHPGTPREAVKETVQDLAHSVRALQCCLTRDLMSRIEVNRGVAL